MLDHKIWTCPPQVKDLPRDTEFGVTCRACGAQWRETAQSLIEVHHLGVEYVDLLEWKYRCRETDCDGMVLIARDGVGVSEPSLKPQALTVNRAKGPERLPYPSKAVVKPRLYEPPHIPAASRRRQAVLPLFA